MMQEEFKDIAHLTELAEREGGLKAHISGILSEKPNYNKKYTCEKIGKESIPYNEDMGHLNGICRRVCLRCGGRARSRT